MYLPEGECNRRLQKKYHNKEFHDLGPSPSIIMMMGWVEPTALTVLMRNA